MERNFRRTDAARKDRDLNTKLLPRLVWMQPGGQRIGDQTFDAFAYSDRDAALDEYTASWKVTKTRDDFHDRGGVLNPVGYSVRATGRLGRKGLILYVAIFLSAAGFIVQFIGLRSLHSFIAIVNLGSMLIMSSLRSLLRSGGWMRKIIFSLAPLISFGDTSSTGSLSTLQDLMWKIRTFRVKPAQHGYQDGPMDCECAISWYRKSRKHIHFRLRNLHTTSSR